MKEHFRVYYYFIIGAFGGLTGWLIGTWLFRLTGMGSNIGDAVGQQVMYGAALGAAIGLSVAAYDGLASRSLIRFAKFGGIGLLLGAVAGAIASPLAYKLYGLFGPDAASTASTSAAVRWVFVGVLCWILFGGLIGLSEGFSKGTQSWKGLLGGTAGAAAGGLIYELNRISSSDTEATYRQQFFLALTLMLLGAAISVAIALITSALKQAWVEVQSGKFGGRTFDVTKYVDRKLGAHRSGIIGSDQWSSHIYLPGDTDVLPRHAEISFTNGAPTLTVTPEASKRNSTFVNGRRISASCPLSDGDRLQVGSTKMVYHQKRK